MSLRVALLGSGLATGIHSKTLRSIAPSIQRWYASRDAVRASAMASRFGGSGHFGSYAAALERADIDAVTIGLPPALHLEWTLAALAAGKHVIVEKPPFLRSADFATVDAAARRAGRQVMVAENYFYKPLTGVLRSAIAGGDLGQVLFVQLNALKRQPTGNWRDDGAMAGGGALFEGGIHWISLLASIGLTPVRVSAAFPDRVLRSSAAAGSERSDAGSERTDAGSERTRPTVDASFERSALVTMEYAEGGVATLAYSWDLPGVVNGLRISRVYGTGGVMRFETNGLFALQTGRRTRLAFPGVRDLAGYRAMMADFVRSIEENRPPKYDLSLARRDLRLVEQAYASNDKDNTTHS